MSLPLWAVHREDLEMPARAHSAMISHGLSMAWHAAAICDRCFLQTRNCGKDTVRRIREALALHGFTMRLSCCAEPASWSSFGKHVPSACQQSLEKCRAMLERGEWS